MSEEDLKKYYEFITEIWRLFKAHHNAKTSEEWDKLLDEAEKLTKKSPLKSEGTIGKKMVNNGMLIVMCILEEIGELNKGD